VFLLTDGFSSSPSTACISIWKGRETEGGETREGGSCAASSCGLGHSGQNEVMEAETCENKECLPETGGPAGMGRKSARIHGQVSQSGAHRRCDRS